MASVSPASPLIEPFAAPSEMAPKAVGSVPLKTPVPPTSVRVTVSSSSVSRLRTITVSVPVPARSASSTDSVAGCPGVVAAMVGTPVTPPAMGSVAVSVVSPPEAPCGSA